MKTAWTAFFSIFSLVLIYLYTLLVFLLSKNILELEVELYEDNEPYSEGFIKQVIKILYRKKRPLIMFIFWLFQVTLFFSVILFIRSAYLFYYG